MVYTFARVSAAVGITLRDVYTQDRRLWIKLHEKGSKQHPIPCHHNLEAYLSEYLQAGSDTGNPKDHVFRTIDRKNKELSARPFTRHDALKMMKRRAKRAGIKTPICNHSFRGTGITTFLENGGDLDIARRMAAHAATKTTQLYDRLSDAIDLDDIERIILD